MSGVLLRERDASFMSAVCMRFSYKTRSLAPGPSAPPQPDQHVNNATSGNRCCICLVNARLSRTSQGMMILGVHPVCYPE